MTYRLCLTLTALALLAGLAAVRPAPAGSDAHRRRFEAVWRKLLDNMEPVPGVEWPPRYEIVPTIGRSWYNACASAEAEGGKLYPLVRITVGYLDEVTTNDDALALTLGHELGHIHHRHVLEARVPRPLTAGNAHTRSQEYEADLFGARLAIKANYSLRKGILAKRQGFERIKGLYPSLEAFEMDHPGWSDRFARLAEVLDNEQLALWRSMSSYENGVTFLRLRQYPAAEACFERVVREFPRCHEAWANLGVARLMCYCDELSTHHLRELGVGQVLGATFYLQPDSLAKRLSRDRLEKLWQDAVQALRRSLDLRPAQPLVRANLGLAFLVHPGGKEVGLGEAERYLQEAVDGLDGPDRPDPETQVALLVNLGVARLAGGRRAEGLRLLEQAAALEPALRRGAVGYNRAMALADGTDRRERTEAAALLEDYLRGNDPGVTWWALAFERYQELCWGLGRPARGRDELHPARPPRTRRCLAVTLAGGPTVALTDPADEVVRRLGEPARRAKEPGTSLRRLSFPRHAIELLIDEQEVVAILLTGPTAPAVTVRGTDPGAGALAVFRVGMARKDVEAMPGGGGYVHRPLTHFGRSYHYYRPLGLAVHYDRPGPDGVVEELALVVIPEGDL